MPRMDADQLRLRFKLFALAIVRFVRLLPRTADAPVLGKQLLRSATSAAANYRAACRGRSSPEFFAKLCIALEEIDESVFWLELIDESKLASGGNIVALLKEANELTAILAASRKTMKSGRAAGAP